MTSVRCRLTWPTNTSLDMESTGDAPSHSPTGAFDMDMGSVSLVEAFAACNHCLEHASAYSKAHGPSPYALKLSLLKLRLSRWGEANGVYQEHMSEVNDYSVEDVNVAKFELSQLLDLLDVDGPATDHPVLANVKRVRTKPESLKIPRIRLSLVEMQPVLETIDAITAGRMPVTRKLPASPRLAQYEGRVSWPSEKIEAIARVVDRLEKVFGTRGLRDLSAEERRQLALDHPDEVVVIGNEAKGVDPWTSELVNNCSYEEEWMVEIFDWSFGSALESDGISDQPNSVGSGINIGDGDVQWDIYEADGHATTASRPER